MSSPNVPRFHEDKFNRGSIIVVWITAPRFRGDKFTPAKAGAVMTNLII